MAVQEVLDLIDWIVGVDSDLLFLTFVAVFLVRKDACSHAIFDALVLH